MAIPANINKQHILKAISEIDGMSEIPPRRKSRKYALNYGGRKYPPKLVISIANKFANREELSPDARVFTTYMAQDYLRNKDFKDIIKIK